MMCLYFLAILIVTQGFDTDKGVKVRRESKLSKPSVFSLTTVDPLGFKLEWEPVTSKDPTDPVTGYKVKLWEVPEVTRYINTIINGITSLIEERVPVEAPSNQIPAEDPEVITTNNTNLLYNKMKLDVLYEARVQAFTKTEEGPDSEPVRIKVHATQ